MSVAHAMTPPTTVADATDEARWQAVQARDAEADGLFVYGVLTTGVYCRPSCASRGAKRENVRFYRLHAEAEAAGLRPCKRCRPNEISTVQRNAQLVEAACRLLETAEAEPGLDALAAGAGLSRFHFHRIFKEVTGVTPKHYAKAARARRVEDQLRAAPSVTAAIYDSGFASSGRFYEAAKGTLGMTPSAFRAGGKGERIDYAFGQSSLGLVLVARTERGICAIRFGEDEAALEAELAAQLPDAVLMPGGATMTGWLAQTLALIEQPNAALELPLDIQGTAFQRQVWQALRAIPAGETRSYGALAAEIGQPKAVRAVARACAANKLAVAIPCHRIVRGDGELGGYRWGEARKRMLLEREGGR